MTDATLAVAVAQFSPTDDAAANLQEISRLAVDAASRGALLVVFPEYSSYYSPKMGPDWVEAAQSLHGPFVRGIAEVAAELGVHIVAGMLEIIPGEAEKASNTLVAVSPGWGGRRALSQDPPLRRVRHPGVGLDRARHRRAAAHLRGGRLHGRDADLLRRPVPGGNPAPRRRRRRPRGAAESVAAGSAQGVGVAHAGHRPGAREHGLRGSGRTGAALGSRQQHGRRPDGRRARHGRREHGCRGRVDLARAGRAGAARSTRRC